MEGINNILTKNPDHTLYWSGDSIPELGIEKGMSLDVAISKFAKAFVEYKNVKVETKPVKGCTDCQTFVDRDNAIFSILNKIENLSTSDIKHAGVTQNPNRLSGTAAKYVGETFAYSITAGTDGSKLSVNLSGLSDQQYSTRVVVSGKSTNGKNIIMDTPEKVSAVTVENSMYPINLDVVVRMDTPGGIVDLTKTLTLYNPAETGDFKAAYDVKDRSHAQPYTGMLDEWLGGVEATQFKQEQFQDAIKTATNGDLPGTIAGQKYLIDGVYNKLEGMSTVTLSLKDSTGGTTTKTITPQVAIDSLSQKVNLLSTENSSLKSELKAVQGVLGNVSNPSGGGTPGTTSDAGQSLATGLT